MPAVFHKTARMLTAWSESGKVYLTDRLVKMGAKTLKPLNEQEPKLRILHAATTLFSQKGYDATGVNEIAKAAQVNKALIYYYFENKGAILDSLIHSLMSSIYEITISFASDCLGTMTKDESLVIEEDRFLFVNHKAMEDFTAKLHRYYKEVVDYTLDNRAIVRILLFESLKGVKHESSLFRFMELMEKRLDDPLYRTVQIGQPNFNYHEATVFYEFFFSIIPLVGIAAYYDEYQAKSHLSDERLRELALQSYMAHAQTNNVQKFFVAES